jgi:hypothetical protein
LHFTGARARRLGGLAVAGLPRGGRTLTVNLAGFPGRRLTLTVKALSSKGKRLTASHTFTLCSGHPIPKSLQLRLV